MNTVHPPPPPPPPIYQPPPPRVGLMTVQRSTDQSLTRGGANLADDPMTSVWNFAEAFRDVASFARRFI